MPWLTTSPMEQRERFIRDHRLDLYAMAELCVRYGISRKTGYKWLAPFEDGGRQGLQDRSRAPHRCPHRIGEDVASVICAVRRPHPSGGPAKLLAWLRPRYRALGQQEPGHTQCDIGPRRVAAHHGGAQREMLDCET
jgi:putative transposase